jgi:sulfur-oxidizing protein SoxA
MLAAACGPAQRPGLDPRDIRSGYTFLTPDTQALQDDDFANPGYLWVDRGAGLFAAASPGGKSCAGCHGENGARLVGAATRYPAIDAQSRALVNLEGRINLCRARHQSERPLNYESDELLALTAYVANLSRGQKSALTLTRALRAHYAAGRRYFFTRRGQFNLACTQCHDANWGRRLRGDVVSQGHANGFPAYRLEWQALGSLHRRLRDCDVGVRATPKPPGSQAYTELELYLAQRGAGLPVEAPAVRR